MRHLSLAEVLEVHRRVVGQSGGHSGLRDVAALEAAVAQPRMTFDGKELYESLASKAAALCYSLVSNHPFVDGNKRVGHAAMETFLVLNGQQIETAIDEAENLMLGLASGTVSRQQLVEWIVAHLGPV